MSSPEPLCGALAGFTLVRFLVFYIHANWFPNHRTARTSKPEYSRELIFQEVHNYRIKDRRGELRMQKVEKFFLGGQRNSNLELFRIITMVMIVASHYVANSGLSGLVHEAGKIDFNSVFLILFGWGETVRKLG